MEPLQDNQCKQYVTVICEHRTDGSLRPISFQIDDELAVKIERLLDARRAASLKCGGQGMRYTCRVDNATIYLYHDRDKWFMEANSI